MTEAPIPLQNIGQLGSRSNYNNSTDSNRIKSSMDGAVIKASVLCALLLVGFFLILLCIFPNLSYIRYDEVGFKKNSFTNDVDESEAHGMGVYFWGFYNSPIVFPATFRSLKFKLNVASKTGLNFELNVDIFYRLSSKNLPKIFRKLGRSYEARFRDSIKAAVKNTAVKFTVDEFIEQRVNISKSMRHTVNEEFEIYGLEVEPHKFLVQEVHFPYQLKNKFLNTAVQQLRNEQAELQQKIDQVTKETERLTEEIRKNITLVYNSASAKYNNDVIKAKSEATTTKQESLSDGLKLVFDALTTDGTKLSKENRENILKYYTIIDNENLKVIEGGSNIRINMNAKK